MLHSSISENVSILLTTDIPDIICFYDTVHPHQRYPYFDIVVGFALSSDTDSYASNSVPTGRDSHDPPHKTSLSSKHRDIKLERKV
jgi:hypothetical protein